MNKRPLPVTVLGWLYIVVGVGGIAAHIGEIKPRHFFEPEVGLPLVVRLLGILAGAFMLRGSNWARWLAVAWIGFHVVLSSFLSVRAAVMHAVLCLVFTYLLFRPGANRYFRARGDDSVTL